MRITRPVLSEKTLTLAAKGWYTFAALPKARKEQIAKDIAQQYKVTVVDIRTVRMPQKSRRVGKQARPVTIPSWKKAMVRLTKGQTIDVFEAAASQSEGVQST